MDPSVFFGRSRVTRQALKPKQQLPDKENVSCEVKPNSLKKGSKSIVKETKVKPVKGAKEEVSLRLNPVQTTPKKGRKRGKKNDELNNSSNAEVKPVPRKSRKVHFDENEGEENGAPKSTGCPVYKNVRRSDEVGALSDPYDFPVDENDVPLKKKRPRKNVVKKPKGNRGTVKWDPSKKPILGKVTKPKLTKAAVQETAKCTTSKPIIQDVVPTSAVNKQPTKEQLHISNHQEAVFDEPNLHSSGLSPNFRAENQFTSTPVAASNRSSSKIRKATVPLIQFMQSGKTASLKKGRTESLPPDPVGSICNTSASSRSESCSRRQQTATPVLTPTRCTSFSALPSICVRESPSFIDVEPSCGNSLVAPATPHSSSAAITSTPKTGNITSKTKQTTQVAALSSQKEVICSPHPVSEVQPSLPARQGDDSMNLSGLFDDIPRTSVIPSRMFSTHRGTICNADTNITKRKLPELSPRKENSSRPTTVKFSAPQVSSNVDNWFGFDDDDNSSTFIPKPSAKSPRSMQTRSIVSKVNGLKKPTLSIQEVQALIRGQLQLSSPANGTPRIVQTKLTDFVSSTPTSSNLRSDKKSEQVVLTPTPVPLFGEEHLDTDLPSPFTQPSRRSYDRFRPIKRIACGDEVHSDDEIDEDATNQEQTESTSMDVKKKSRSYKRKKKNVNTQLDEWAKQLASHFEEVEEVDLDVE